MTKKQGFVMCNNVVIVQLFHFNIRNPRHCLSFILKALRKWKPGRITKCYSFQIVVICCVLMLYHLRKASTSIALLGINIAYLSDVAVFFIKDITLITTRRPDIMTVACPILFWPQERQYLCTLAQQFLLVNHPLLNHSWVDSRQKELKKSPCR